MSNKPRIYAKCPAGCNWETIHKEDFDNSFPLVPVRLDELNRLTLEKGKRYRIFDNAQVPNEYSFNINVKTLNQVNLIGLPKPTFDKFKPYVDFTLLEVGLDENYYTQIIYELNGERKVYSSRYGFYNVSVYTQQFDTKHGTFREELNMPPFTYDTQVVSNTQITRKIYARTSYDMYGSYDQITNSWVMKPHNFRAGYDGDVEFVSSVDMYLSDTEYELWEVEGVKIPKTSINNVTWKTDYTPASEGDEYEGIRHEYVSKSSGNGSTATYKLYDGYICTNFVWGNSYQSKVLVNSEVSGINYTSYYAEDFEADLTNFECYASNVDHAFIYNDGAETIVKPESVFIRYADDENGTNMTDVYNEQPYMGTYTGLDASVVASDYTWMAIGEGGSGSEIINVTGSLTLSSAPTDERPYSTFTYTMSEEEATKLYNAYENNLPFVLKAPLEIDGVVTDIEFTLLSASTHIELGQTLITDFYFSFTTMNVDGLDYVLAMQLYPPQQQTSVVFYYANVTPTYASYISLETMSYFTEIETRIKTLENTIGDINTVLDTINGEVI